MGKNTISITIISMVIILATVTSLVLADIDNKDDRDEEQDGDKNGSVVCTKEYAPVCGVDGNTYSNRCVAEEQEGVEVDHEGECEKEFTSCTDEQKEAEACTMEYNPVCGDDGKTYGNKCLACAEGIESYEMGEC